MPNHIQNRLEFVGSKSDIAKLNDAIKENENRIDFNKIVPMPPDITIEIHSGIENAVQNALKTPLSDNPLLAGLQSLSRSNEKSPLDLNNKDWDSFVKCLQNKRKYGFIYWYDWAVSNWGTKWNAYDTPDKRDTVNCIYFQTAWSCVDELIQKLSIKFPTILFKYTFADEDCGSNVGYIEFRGGKVIAKKEYVNNSNEAWEVYFELHPEDKENFEFVNGKWECKDN